MLCENNERKTKILFVKNGMVRNLLNFTETAIHVEVEVKSLWDKNKNQARINASLVSSKFKT